MERLRSWGLESAPITREGMMKDVRECRLRPEFAHLYEELTPGVWVPALEGAEQSVMRARKARHLSIHQRALDPGHFEFRGGERPAHLPGAQSRRDDRRAHGVAGNRRPPARVR
jgi:hypothetical protein